MAELKLDLLVLDTHNPQTLGIGDLSFYPTGKPIVEPTIEITPAGWPKVALDFTEKQVNIYNSLNLGITCADEDLVNLPDGLYTVKYSIAPSYKNFVTKTFMKVDRIYEMLDSAFLKNDITHCDSRLSEKNKLFLEEIEFYINVAIAAANQCANKAAIEAYSKALKLIKTYNNNNC